MHTPPCRNRPVERTSKAPARITTTEPRRQRGDHRRLGSAASASERRRHRDDDQLADLDAEVEREQRPAERLARQAELLQHGREPKAMDQTKEAGKDGRASSPAHWRWRHCCPAQAKRLSVPTTTMLRAMTGSMIRAGRGEDVERRQRQA